MSASAIPNSRSSDAAVAAPAWPTLAVLGAALAAVAIQLLWIPLDADVSWLITVCERVLAGDRLYVDIVEVNPPASVWLYLPLVWAAARLTLRPEAVIAAAFVAGGLMSTFASARLIAEDTDNRGWVAPLIAFVLLILPMGLFAQREHAALLLAVPALAALARIADNRALSLSAKLIAGAAAGLVIVLKPPFALAIVLPAIWAAVRRGSARPLLVSAAVAAAVVLLYAAAFLVLEPAYFPWLQVFSATYLRMHEAWWKLFAGGIVIFPALCLGFAAVLRAPRVPSVSIAWGLGSAGFAAAALLQAKNYPNHWLPGAALGLLAVAALLSVRDSDAGRRRLVAVAMLVLAAIELRSTAIVPEPAVAAAIEQVAPPSPSIMALSSQLSTGHPVTRNVGGQWVGSRAGLFTAAGARYVGTRDPRVEAAYREDINAFASDLRRHRPDVVLVNEAEKSWLLGEPAIRAAMRGYRPAANTGEVEVWLRR